MGVRTVAGLAVLALLGLGAGWGVGEVRQPQPADADATPIVASGPSYPHNKPVIIKRDSDFPTLVRNLPSHEETLGKGVNKLTVQIPDGWVRYVREGEVRWYPPPGVPTAADPTTLNTYFMRITLIGQYGQTIGEALDRRISALRGATGVARFHVENRSSDTFNATYVSDQHLRVTLERFISSPAEPDVAFASIAVIGRAIDRDGLTSLLENVTDSAVNSLAAAAAKDDPSDSPSPSASSSPSESASPTP